MDTGGLVPGSTDSMDIAVREQVELAVEEADLIVFVVDGKEGLNPVDREIAAQLRRAGRPVLLAVNKLDDLPNTHGPATASTSWGSAIRSRSRPRWEGKRRPARRDRGRAAAAEPRRRTRRRSRWRWSAARTPEVLAHQPAARRGPRLVVAAEPGTTRDAIDTPLRYHGKTLNFIDTAGLRRRAKVEDDIEFYSTLRTQRAIERADVCVLVVDAERGMHTQDLRIATEAWDRGAGLIIAVNKWDLIQEKDANTAKRGRGPAGREGAVPPVRAVPLRLGAHRASG